jgi:hypothetical protein
MWVAAIAAEQQAQRLRTCGLPAYLQRDPSKRQGH